MSRNNFDRAMDVAREYRDYAERYGNNHAHCYQLRDTIFGWVGSWDKNGKPVLPAVIREAMGATVERWYPAKSSRV